MKKWISSLFVVALISGCSTPPSTPTPHMEKYTFQVIHIEIPEATFQTPLPDVEELIQYPNAKISEYPIVLAGLGESVTNDQTKSVLMPEDYDIVDGELIAKEKIVKLGYSTSITVDKIENGVVSYHLNASYQELKGFDEHKTEGGIAKMPFFNRRAVNTNLTQQPNSWVSMGGLVDETNGEKISLFIGIRIIPPIADK